MLLPPSLSNTESLKTFQTVSVQEREPGEDTGQPSAGERPQHGAVPTDAQEARRPSRSTRSRPGTEGRVPHPGTKGRSKRKRKRRQI